eukprot:14447808-Ditylum_brightwellii.AAC.2
MGALFLTTTLMLSAKIPTVRLEELVQRVYCNYCMILRLHKLFACPIGAKAKEPKYKSTYKET